jgi:hypothetical protein
LHKRKWLVLSIIILLLVFSVAYAITFVMLPETITIFTGENYTISFKSPLFLQAFTNSSILKISDSSDSVPNALKSRIALPASNRDKHSWI